MKQCSIHGGRARCGCCACALADTGRVRSASCPVATHRKGLDSMRIAELTGHQMRAIMDAKWRLGQ